MFGHCARQLGKARRTIGLGRPGRSPLRHPAPPTEACSRSQVSLRSASEQKRHRSDPARAMSLPTLDSYIPYPAESPSPTLSPLQRVGGDPAAGGAEPQREGRAHAAAHEAATQVAGVPGCRLPHGTAVRARASARPTPAPPWSPAQAALQRWRAETPAQRLGPGAPTR